MPLSGAAHSGLTGLVPVDSERDRTERSGAFGNDGVENRMKGESKTGCVQRSFSSAVNGVNTDPGPGTG